MSLSNQYTPPTGDYNIEDIKKDDGDHSLFVRKNYAYYRRSWLRLMKEDGNAKRGVFPSVNFGAALCGVLWLIYRKMYLYAFIATVGQIALTVIFTRPELGLPMPDLLATYFIAVILFITGNSIYLLHVGNKIKDIRLGNPSNAVWEIKKAGGTNMTAPIIILAIICLLVVIAIATGQF